MNASESKRFSKKVENFSCEMCGAKVAGSGYTDHCPKCLWGKHVDINPGDRASECKGLMRPMLTEHDRKGFIIEYRCEKCKIKKNFSASEDDDKEILFRLLG